MSQEQKYAGKRRTQQSYKKVKIRPRGSSWQADFGTRAGKRDQKSFGSLDEARQAIDIHLLQVAEQSRFEAIGKKDKMIGWHNLSEREKVDAVSALEMLADRVSLMDAARHDLSLPCRMPTTRERFRRSSVSTSPARKHRESDRRRSRTTRRSDASPLTWATDRYTRSRPSGWASENWSMNNVSLRTFKGVRRMKGKRRTRRSAY